MEEEFTIEDKSKFTCLDLLTEINFNWNFSKIDKLAKLATEDNDMLIYKNLIGSKETLQEDQTVFNIIK